MTHQEHLDGWAARLRLARPLPAMRRHHGLGMAYVQFRVGSRRRTVYLGKWASAAAAAKYRRFERKWPAPLAENPARGTWPAPRLLTFDGRTQTLAKWARERGLKPTTVRHRLAAGWSVERALTEQTHNTRRQSMEPGGEVLLNSKQVAKRLGVSVDVVQRWALHGCPINGVRVPLECIHAGTQYRFRPEFVERFTENCRKAKIGDAFVVPETPDAERKRGERDRLDALAACDAT